MPLCLLGFWLVTDILGWGCFGLGRRHEATDTLGRKKSTLFRRQQRQEVQQILFHDPAGFESVEDQWEEIGIRLFHRYAGSFSQVV